MLTFNQYIKEGYQEDLNRINKLRLEINNLEDKINKEYKPKLISFIYNLLDNMEKEYGKNFHYLHYLEDNYNDDFYKILETDIQIDGQIFDSFDKDKKGWYIKVQNGRITSGPDAYDGLSLEDVDVRILDNIVKLYISIPFFSKLINKDVVKKINENENEIFKKI